MNSRPNSLLVSRFQLNVIHRSASSSTKSNIIPEKITQNLRGSKNPESDFNFFDGLMMSKSCTSLLSNEIFRDWPEDQSESPLIPWLKGLPASLEPFNYARGLSIRQSPISESNGVDRPENQNGTPKLVDFNSEGTQITICVPRSSCFGLEFGTAKVSQKMQASGREGPHPNLLM